ncbi:hypothetical protein [Desulfobulbus elongatus]|uniref:hypothetical protein n=1 Tax=Desulfobulbus elongatus TaxID=53332 RepID=UPI0012FCF2F2|nr:hypothetical protein [Desulfobulbus elongatus]
MTLGVETDSTPTFGITTDVAPFFERPPLQRNDSPTGLPATFFQFVTHALPSSLKKEKALSHHPLSA